MLARISLSLDKVEQKQAATLTDLEERIDTRARRTQGVLSDLGVNLGRASADTATGGPFVPARPPQSGGSSFERQLYRITVARARIDRYSRTLLTVPVRKPIIGEVDMSSPFGTRMDPFVKGPAGHRLAWRHRRPGARHRQSPSDGRQLAGRLWDDGGNRSRECTVHPLRPHVRNRRQSWRPGPDRTDHRQGRLDRVLLARICITKHGSMTKRSIPSGFCGRDCGSAIFSRPSANYSTSSTFSGPPPKVFCASAACMNSSRSPSSTPVVFDVETPVRKSFTI